MTSTTPGAPTVIATAPMTFGQMSVWRDIDKLPRHRWHEPNVAHHFALPQPVSRRQLADALTRIDAKHEAVRTVFDVNDPIHPTQQLLPPQLVEDVETVFAGPDRVEELTLELKGRAFDLRTDRGFRVLAFADGPETEDLDAPNLRELAFSVHHLTADGWSLGLLMTDLFAFLGLGGEELPPAPSSLIDIANEQRSAAVWQAKLKATQKHFRAVYESEPAEFRDRDPEQTVLNCALESTLLCAAGRTLTDRYKVSMATVFTAAFLDAVAGFCTSGSIRVGLMTSNRFLERWRNQVTTMNQLIPMLADADPGLDFAERIASTQVATVRAFRLGLFDPDQVTPQALGLSAESTQLYSLCMVNFSNGVPVEIVDPETPGEPPMVHWEPAFSKIARSCYLRVHETTGDTLRLRLRTGELPAEVAEAILRNTYQRVLDAAG